MKKIDICENENLMENLEILRENGYRFIIKAKDKMLSGWGNSGRGGHVQLIACKTEEEKQTILRDLYSDSTFCYIDWQFISSKENIRNYTRNKSYTIRNDWTRCF